MIIQCFFIDLLNQQDNKYIYLFKIHSMDLSGVIPPTDIGTVLKRNNYIITLHHVSCLFVHLSITIIFVTILYQDIPLQNKRVCPTETSLVLASVFWRCEQSLLCVSAEHYIGPCPSSKLPFVPLLILLSGAYQCYVLSHLMWISVCFWQ